MYCAHCGSNVADNAARCPKCGRPVKGVRSGRRPPIQGGARPPQATGQPSASPLHSPGQHMTIVSGAHSAPQTGGAATIRNVGPSTGSGGPHSSQGISITFIEGGTVVAETTLLPGTNQSVRFGSASDNDLVVAPPSGTISGHHGSISMAGGWCVVRDLGSSNGLYLNGRRLREFRVAPGDVVSVGMPKRGARRCVMVVGEVGHSWEVFSLANRDRVVIGRMPGNDLVLQDPTVSGRHAFLTFDGARWIVADAGSTNGTKVSGTFIFQPTPVDPGSTLGLGGVQLVVLDGCLLVPMTRHGVDVDGRDLVRYRKNGKTTRITTDHISLHIKRGEFVAIIGGSGCGKSTLLNELNGSEPADEGSVMLDGTDLYANFKMLKSSIGYVPQQDIVYDDLRLEDMLAYAAKLRMQSDTTAEERRTRVEEVIALLELDGVRHNYIGKLSGGQKKRASIAVELLADPRLLFLDEPTSGLDPGIERKLMQSLAKMAHEGRTIILVTHTTLNLHLCDQVVFLGAGGKLCYAGDPQGAKTFFGVSDYVEVYPKIDENPGYWEQQFAMRPKLRETPNPHASNQESLLGKSHSSGFFRQVATLIARYAHLIVNDRGRLLLMVLQAPLLAELINLVAASDVFGVCEDTKFYLFAVSCAAFWVGIFDSIQEICKETSIFRRECDGGLRIGAYLISKVVVLGALCLIQTILLVAVLILFKGTPAHSFLPPVIELGLSTYLTVISAMSVGLLVSALFHSPDKALAMAPILIMPQILFSGIAFELNGVTEKISYAINCRWAIEALGTSAGLNDLDLAIYGEEITVPAEERTLENQTIHVPETTTEVDVGAPIGKKEVTVPAEDRTFETLDVTVPEMKDTVDAEMIEHEEDEMFEHTFEHLMRSWGILIGMSLICILGCFLCLVLGMRK